MRSCAEGLTARVVSGLEWSLRHNDTGRGSMNMEIGRIIYELTGVYHNRKVISSHLQALKDCLTRMKSSVPILSDVRDSVHRLEELEATHDMGNIRETIKYLVEERLPDLLREFELEEMGHLAPERPAVRFGGQSAVTAHAEVFQMMSEMVPEGGDGRGLRLFVTGGPLTLKECPSWRKDFGITLVNRFHRTGALAALASNLVFDFTDNVDAFHRLQQRLPMGVSIRYMRLLFVEGHMDFGFAEFLASDGAVSVLPDLLEVLVELWPRDMKRGSYDSMEWGVQTVRLLELLTRWRGRVVVRWRFKTDCERFESEYVGVRGWRRMEGTEVEGGGPEEAMCQRDYEFKGK